MGTRMIKGFVSFAIVLFALNVGPVIAAGPGLHGRVLGHDEQGKFLGVVANARIIFQSTAGTKIGEVVSNEHGYYKMDLGPGEYHYKIKAEGYRSQDAGRGLRISQSQGYAIFNLSLTQGVDEPNRKEPEIPSKMLGKLRGRFLDQAMTGTIGIPGARLALRKENSKEHLFVYGRSAGSGKLQIGEFETAIEFGTYYATASAEGFETLVDPNPIVIESEKVVVRNFLMKRLSLPEAKDQGIKGAVSVVDSETPTPSIKLSIQSIDRNATPKIDVSLEKNGAFKRDLPAGRYQVMASADGFPNATSPVVFVYEGRYTPVNLVLKAKGVPDPKTAVEVYVYEQESDKGPPKPLGGSQVTLRKKGSEGSTFKNGVTDATGHAIFPVLEGGEYFASATRTGYLSAGGAGSVQVGQVYEIGILLVKEVEPPTKIELIAVATDQRTKKPLAGVRLVAQPIDENEADTDRSATDQHGAATLHLKKPGKYRVIGHLVGYEPTSSVTEVSIGSVHRLAIELKPIAPSVVDPPLLQPNLLHPIKGYVAARDGTEKLRAVPNTKLHWERVSPSTPHFSTFAVTSSDGRYSVQLQEGIYQVRIEPPTGFDADIEQVAISSTTHEKYFIVDRADRKPLPDSSRTRVNGVVVTEVAGRFINVENAEVIFMEGTSTERASSNSLGQFSVQLPSGPYRAKVLAKGYEVLNQPIAIHANMDPLRFVLKRLDSMPNLLGLKVVVVEERKKPSAMVQSVADAKVHLSIGNQNVASGVTDRNGQFLAQIKPGSYQLRVDKPGYATVSKSITIGSSSLLERVVLTPRLDPSGERNQKPKLTVRVVQKVDKPSMQIRKIGDPLPGASVVVMLGSKQVARGVTNAQGIWSLPLDPSTYSIKVEATGFAPSGRVFVLGGSDSQVDFQLERHEPTTEEVTTSDIDRRPIFPPVRPGRDGETASNIHYIVEYRHSSRSNWIQLSTASTERDANLALFRAIEQGRIPGSAETRIRAEKIRLDASRLRPK